MQVPNADSDHCASASSPAQQATQKYEPLTQRGMNQKQSDGPILSSSGAQLSSHADTCTDGMTQVYPPLSVSVKGSQDISLQPTMRPTDLCASHQVHAIASSQQPKQCMTMVKAVSQANTYTQTDDPEAYNKPVQYKHGAPMCCDNQVRHLCKARYALQGANLCML